MNAPLRVLVMLAAALISARPAAAEEPYLETVAPQAVIMDGATGEILFEKNAREPVPPSSMSKLMTVLMVFERLKEGRLSLDDRFDVSAEAWRRGGAASGSSTMFLEPGERVRVEDLLRGVIVQSGNDAAIVLAEGLSGSEDAFAELMNLKAIALGLEASHFENATGWPHPDHRMSLLDLARVSRRLIYGFPDHYAYFAETEFTWNGIRQPNRNPLLGRGIGVDGLKTGHTEIAGYGLAASAQRGGDRRIVVVNGLQSEAARASETARLLELGFEAFRPVTLVKAGAPVGEVEVWRGESAKLPVVVHEDVVRILHQRALDDVRAHIRYRGPVVAPIVKGQPVGELVIETPGGEPLRRPVIAAATVDRLGPLGVIGMALDRLIFGSDGGAEPSAAADRADG